MNGLLNIPNEVQLLQAYEKLQFNPAQIKVAELALWSQWVRFDPRIGELIVRFYVKHWQSIHPHLLRQELLIQPWPQTMGVIFEFVDLLLDSHLLFRAWAQFVTVGFPPLKNAELFFVGVFQFAGKQSKLDAEYALRPFLKWGYLSSHPLIDVSISKTNLACRQVTLLDSTKRQKILQKLQQEKNRITVFDYQSACGMGVLGLRQAQRDLKMWLGSKAIGNTKGRSYGSSFQNRKFNQTLVRKVSARKAK